MEDLMWIKKRDVEEEERKDKEKKQTLVQENDEEPQDAEDV